jgi:hypothetical protein
LVENPSRLLKAIFLVLSNKKKKNNFAKKVLPVNRHLVVEKKKYPQVFFSGRHLFLGGLGPVSSQKKSFCELLKKTTRP